MSSIDLVWIVATDFKKTVQFYTDVVGLKLMEMNEEWNWAELQGESGARLGIGGYNAKNPVATPGQNAIITFTVNNIEKSKANMIKKGAVCVGDIEEVPGHVRMQLFRDVDGNLFQLVQLLHT